MEIAKGIQDTDYKVLDLSDYQSKNWDIAIEYLEKRLNERFVEPTEILIASEDSKPAIEKKYGFTILAIDCLLIETLQSFYEGVTDSSKQSKDLFVRFLRNRILFKTFFSSDVEAEDFYKKFRCGILHQAQTASDTKVWSVGRLLFNDGSYLIVNRDLFHISLRKELANYFSELKNRTNIVLLENFKKKMDFICGE